MRRSPDFGIRSILHRTWRAACCNSRSDMEERLGMKSKSLMNVLERKFQLHSKLSQLGCLFHLLHLQNLIDC